MSAPTAAHGTPHTARNTRSIGHQVSAGIVGGLVFGALMAMMDMLPMIASLVGSTSAGVGFGVHLVISVLTGLGLMVLLGHTLSSYGRGAIGGLLYGALWWVLGPLLIMPLMMGMPVFTLDAPALWSLMGHLIYGLILGVAGVAALNRSR